jgi:hypothetical protein
MNASKTLIASIVAATIVGTVGFVSAQSTDAQPPASQKATDSMGTPNGTPAAPADMSSPGFVAPANDPSPAPSAAMSSSTQPAAERTVPSADTLSPTEPAPKADRN